MVWAARIFAIALIFVAQGRREEVGTALGRLWSCGWKELEGDGMWAVNRASELVVLTRQPMAAGGAACACAAEGGYLNR
jgi:hypothetical protein